MARRTLWIGCFLAAFIFGMTWFGGRSVAEAQEEAPVMTGPASPPESLEADLRALVERWQARAVHNRKRYWREHRRAKRLHRLLYPYTGTG